MYDQQQYWYEISKVGPRKVNRIPNATKLENASTALMVGWYNNTEKIILQKCLGSNYSVFNDTILKNMYF